MGNSDGAIADFTKAIQIKPDCAKAYRSRCRARQAQNKAMSAANADLAKANRLDSLTEESEHLV